MAPTPASIIMPLIVLSTPRLLWVRLAALVFACVAFSVAAHGAALPHGSIADWCIFCWAFSFAGTLLVLLVELFDIHDRVSWPGRWSGTWSLMVICSNFPITIACYAALLCLSASVLFPLWFLKDRVYGEARGYRIASTVFSCLAAVAYVGEVILLKPRHGELHGHMATVPALLKVCQTFLACVIFILVTSDPVTYDSHPALEGCMAVYCICFILSMVMVVLCVGECMGYLPELFAKFLSFYGLLAVIMYLTATITWPVFQFDKRYQGRRDSKVIATAVLTAINFLLYVADLVYSARLVLTGRLSYWS